MSASQAKDHAAFLTDASGIIDTWNAACQRVFGFTADAVVHQPAVSLLAPASRTANEQRWHDLAGQPTTMALDILRADGSTAPADLTLVPQFEDDGSFRGCIACFSIDAANAPISEEELVGQTPLKVVVDLFAGTFCVINRAGHFVLWNHNMERVTQMNAAELRAVRAPDLLNPEHRTMAREKLEQVLEHDAEVLMEADFHARDGTRTPYLFSGKRIRCGDAYYVCGMGLDISARREQEEKLRLRERALHATNNAIIITHCAGPDNPIEYVNPAFERITGYSEAEVLGRDSRFMAAPGLDDVERDRLRTAIVERRPEHVIFRNLRKDGELFWNDLSITPVANESGAVTHFIGVINDVTASKQRTAHLEHEVNHDALTGLANRTLLWDRLEQALHMAQRNKTLVATVLIDLDNFKAINDSWGHEAGDEVLKAVARRLESSVRESDTVARLSGDEFVLVLTNQPSLRFTVRMIERVRDAIARPVSFDSREIPVGASVGVSMYPHDGATVFDLVRAADVAMYHAKASGKKSEAQFFSPDMTSTNEAKQKMEADLRAALERDEIFLVFQPRADLRTGRVNGIEALLRWRHPEHGMLLPASFLAEAEESGMIVPIGERVLEQVCAFMAELKASGFPELCVSMNAVYREFSQQNYIASIAEKLDSFDLLPASLELELREEHLLRNPQVSLEVAGQMREVGMKLSVDNFGDGIVSLEQLQRLGVSHLKMSQASVREICPQSGSGPLAKTLIHIAHDLDMLVVAQGVETRVQMDFLKSNDCDAVQGSYFSEPLSAQAVQQMLREEAHQ